MMWCHSWFVIAKTVCRILMYCKSWWVFIIIWMMIFIHGFLRDPCLFMSCDRLPQFGCMLRCVCSIMWYSKMHSCSDLVFCPQLCLLLAFWRRVVLSLRDLLFSSSSMSKGAVRVILCCGAVLLIHDTRRHCITLLLKQKHKSGGKEGGDTYYCVMGWVFLCHRMRSTTLTSTTILLVVVRLRYLQLFFSASSCWYIVLLLSWRRVVLSLWDLLSSSSSMSKGAVRVISTMLWCCVTDSSWYKEALHYIVVVETKIQQVRR